MSYTDKTISEVWTNGRSNYFWMTGIRMRTFDDGVVNMASYRSTTYQEAFNHSADQMLRFYVGVAHGERCMFPAIVCPWCRKTKGPEAYDRSSNHLDWQDLEFLCLRSNLTPTQKQIDMFERFWASAGHTRYIYKNCGCVATATQAKSYFKELSFDVRWETGSAIQQYLAPHLYPKIEPAFKSAFRSAERSKKRVRKKLTKEAQTFFQMVNASAQLATLQTK